MHRRFQSTWPVCCETLPPKRAHTHTQREKTHNTGHLCSPLKPLSVLRALVNSHRWVLKKGVGKKKERGRVKLRLDDSETTDTSTLVTAPQRVDSSRGTVSKHFAEHTSLMRGPAHNKQGPPATERHRGSAVWAPPAALWLPVGPA